VSGSSRAKRTKVSEQVKTKTRKKLIEVALPLVAINRAAAAEKLIHVGTTSNLHAWWARRPLAACRAVVFASLVDDPGEYLPPEAAEAKRQELFDLIE
jgi:putative DNA methylase